MKIIAIGVLILAFLYVCRSPQPEPEVIYNTQTTGKYDWENDRYITPQVEDTMIQIDGKWYSKNKLPPKPKPMVKQKPTNIHWLRPAGLRSLSHKKMDRYELQQWENQEQITNQLNNQLTEDNVRELIRESHDY
jgi:hypothetical protein